MRALRVVVLSAIWPETIERLQRQFDCVVEFNPSEGRKLELLRTAEVVVVRSPVRLDRSALDAAPALRLIVRAGGGLDAIDVGGVRERGILLVAIPLSADSVAEHALGLLLSISRRIPWRHRSLQEGRWDKHGLPGIELSGKRLGLVGFGRIGIRLAEIAVALRMQVLAYDRSPDKPHKAAAAHRLGVRFMDLDSLLATSDFASVQVPLNKTTVGLVDARRLAAMKPEAILVNVGRGGVVDERALFSALEQRQLRGAALDVFETEPPGDLPLLRLDNFLATPHVAAQTDGAQRRIGEDVLRMIQLFARGEDLPSECVVP